MRTSTSTIIKPEPKVNPLLSPLAWLYGVGVELRNYLFDRGILKQTVYPIPVICVGNLTVGGTGKTPHIEYLIKLLSSHHYKVAVVSRGYKRQSKSMQVVQVNSDVKRVGDEPMQIKLKYPQATVVVDKNRRNAINYLLTLSPNEQPDVVLLDDGYQHRYVKPSLSILLVDRNRPIYEDKLLPAGRLREPLHRKDRASIVLVTKCGDNMQPINYRIFANGLNLFPYQALYFTRFAYQQLQPVFSHHATHTTPMPLAQLRHKQVLLVAGIATTKPLQDKMLAHTQHLHTLFFPDHHLFQKSDIRNIEKKFNKLPHNSDNKIIVTTEKDATRLQALPYISNTLKQHLYYLPIEVALLENFENETFNNKILNHVRNYQNNG